MSSRYQRIWYPSSIRILVQICYRLKLVSFIKVKRHTNILTKFALYLKSGIVNLLELPCRISNFPVHCDIWFPLYNECLLAHSSNLASLKREEMPWVTILKMKRKNAHRKKATTTLWHLPLWHSSKSVWCSCSHDSNVPLKALFNNVSTFKNFDDV